MRHKDRFVKVGSFEVEYAGSRVEVTLRAKVDQHGIQIVKDGKLSLEAESKEHEVRVAGSDKEKLILDVAALFAKKDQTTWTKWLRVEIEWFHSRDERDRQANFEIKYAVIERANIGKDTEMWRRTNDVEVRRGLRGRGSSYSTTKERLKNGHPPEWRHRTGITKKDKDKMYLYVEDSPEKRAAIDELINRTKSIYDRIVAICGPSGKGAPEFFLILSRGGGNLLGLGKE